MQLSLLSVLLFALACNVAGAQESQTESVHRSVSGWRTELEAGALEDRPDIIPVDGGVQPCLLIHSLHPTWFFDSDMRFWYDPVADRLVKLWRSTRSVTTREQWISLSFVYPDISRMLPTDAEPGIQLVDRGSKAVFLVDVGENLADHTQLLRRKCHRPGDGRGRETKCMVLQGLASFGCYRLGFSRGAI